MPDRLGIPPSYPGQIETSARGHLPEAGVSVCGSRISSSSHRGGELDLALRSAAPESRRDAQLGGCDISKHSDIPRLRMVHDCPGPPPSLNREAGQG